jgi:hypothetical protein
MSRKITILTLCLIAALLGIMANSCSGGSEEDEFPSSRAYKGHENDVDINNLCRVYSFAVDTKLDDCSSCHKGEMEGDVQIGNSCDYCHDLMVHGDPGHTYYETLNSYGEDYMDAGRTTEAFYAIQNTDSDGDGYTNKDEILALRYPGYSYSRPNQPEATTIVLTKQQITPMASHEEFILANTNKQQFDDYAMFEGVTIKDLLTNLEIDLTGATGVTISAPDGFQKSFTMEEVNQNYPDPIYDAGLDVATLGTDCGFVAYPAEIPAGLTDLGTIPGDYFLMIAWIRNGAMMDKSYFDPVSGTIEGEGPYRLIVPQSTPGLPDRGSKYSPTTCADGYDYNSGADHNAGSMTRGVVCIRIDPMPSGVEEYNFLNTGWAVINDEELVIYGHGID